MDLRFAEPFSHRMGKALFSDNGSSYLQQGGLKMSQKTATGEPHPQSGDSSFKSEKNPSDFFFPRPPGYFLSIHAQTGGLPEV